MEGDPSENSLEASEISEHIVENYSDVPSLELNSSADVGRSEDRISGETPPRLQYDLSESVTADSPDTPENEESPRSEDVIKLDIRGTAAPKIPFKQMTYIAVDDVIALNDNIVNLKTLLPVKAGDDWFDGGDSRKIGLTDSGPRADCNKTGEDDDEDFEQDYETDELLLNESRNAFPCNDRGQNIMFAFDSSKPSHEAESSVSTATTEYKPLCENFQDRIPEILLKPNIIIEELQLKLNHSLEEKEKMQIENDYLSMEVIKMRQLLAQVSTGGEECKGQLSDFAKHENFLCDNSDSSTKQHINQITLNKNSNFNCDQTKNPFEIFEDMLHQLDNDDKVIFEKFKVKILKSFEDAVQQKCNLVITEEKNKLVNVTNVREERHKLETDRLKTVILSMKSENPDLINLKEELQNIHKKEVEELRTYFEQKCLDMEKHYSDEVYSQQQSRKHSFHSGNTSVDSLNNCPDAMPFGNSLMFADPQNSKRKMNRSYSAEFQIGMPIEKFHAEGLVENLKEQHTLQIEAVSKQYQIKIDELNICKLQYLEELKLCKEQISELKADLQTYQNTIIDGSFCDPDLELEKVLSDANNISGSCPLNLIKLKDKIELESQQAMDQLKEQHSQQLASLRDENSKLLAIESEKYAEKEQEWRSKRYEAFDKNRHLEDIIKERDGLKQLTITLQKVLGQLVDYFNLCEDELNNTFVGELLKQVVDENFEDGIVLNCTLKRENRSDNHLIDETDLIHNRSMVTKKMHFAPDVNGIITYIDPESGVNELDCSQDVSINFKSHLDVCLQRLKLEAQELVALSANKIQKRLSILAKDDEKLLYAANGECEKEGTNDDFKRLYFHCESSRKELEQDLVIAMNKISELTNNQISNPADEIISEGYGILTHPKTPVSLPPHPRIGIMSPPPLLARSEGENTPESARSTATDDPIDKKTPINHNLARRLTAELEATTRVKEDLQMQLEAANKQLRSTRQFLEEQAGEREIERDEFQKELEVLKDENAKLSLKAQQHHRISNEAEQLEIQVREMSTTISELETRNDSIESELKLSQEKMTYLRDIIGNLENQLETKSLAEANAVKDINSYKEMADVRELKLNSLTQELNLLRENLAEQMAKDVLAAGKKHTIAIPCELETEKKLVEQMRNQLHVLVETIMDHTMALESLHEAVCSQSCSSPSEDVSIQNQKNKQEYVNLENSSIIPSSPDKLILQLPLLEVTKLGDTVHKHFKAEEAALKRISDLEMQLIQLKDVAQELRTERDILQERMSEQSLKISSLQSRLDQTRHTAEAMRHQTTEELRLKLDEALSETQLLREALDSRDKQVIRLKALVDETTVKKKLDNREFELGHSLTGTDNKELIQQLKRELQSRQYKISELQDALELKKLQFYSLPEMINNRILVEDNQKCENQLLNKDVNFSTNLENNEEICYSKKKHNPNNDDEGKLSARTLSDILSIQSEFDEEADNVMRKADIYPEACLSTELNLSHFDVIKNQNTPLLMESDMPIICGDSTQQNDNQSDTHSSRKLEEIDNLVAFSHNTMQSSKNCSMFPNSQVCLSDDGKKSIQPKKIDFSLPSASEMEDNKVIESGMNLTVTLEDAKIFNSWLTEIGIDLTVENEETYLGVFNRLRNHISKLLNDIKINNEHLNNLPLIKNEVEYLKKNLLIAQEDKSYYNKKLDEFTSQEQNLRQRLEETLNQLRILNDDFAKKEVIVTELTDEKLLLEQSLVQLEIKYKRLISGNIELQQKETSNIIHLEQTISEKNQQIDSLNFNLDRLEDIQKELFENKQLVGQLSTELKKKCSEIAKLTRINELNIPQEAQLLPIEPSIQISKSESDTNIILSNEENQKQRQMIELQSKLNSKGKDLSIKVFELEKAKLEILDLQKMCEELRHYANDKDKIIAQAVSEKESLQTNLRTVLEKLKEEGDLEDLRAKFNRKSEDCAVLEQDLISLKNAIKKFHDEHADKDGRITMLSIENTQLRDQLYVLEEKLRDQSVLIFQLNNVKQNLCLNIDELQEKSEAEKDTSARLKNLLDSEKQLLSNVQAQDSGVIRLLKNRLEESLDSESELKMLLERERKTSERLLKQINSENQTTQIVNLDQTQDNLENASPTTLALLEKLNQTKSQLEDQVEISELLKSEVMLQKTKFDREKTRLLDLQNILDREKMWFQKEIEASKEQITSLNKQKLELQSELSTIHERVDFLMAENLNLENKLESLRKDDRMEHFERPQKLHSNDDSRSYKIDQDVIYGGSASDTNAITLHHVKEMQLLLKRHIMENAQICQTVKELHRERRELQCRIKELENRNSFKHASSMTNLPVDVDQQVRFLYSRYMRMQSYCKQLVFQKQYLQKALAALGGWDMKLPAIRDNGLEQKGKARFRCVVNVIRSILRMKYLVRRWHTCSKVAANMHLNVPNVFPTKLQSSKSYSHLPTSISGMREKSATSGRLRSSLTNPLYSNVSTKNTVGKNYWPLGDTSVDNNLINQPSNSLLYNLNFGDEALLGSMNSQFVRASCSELNNQLLEERNYLPRKSSTSDNDDALSLFHYMK